MQKPLPEVMFLGKNVLKVTHVRVVEVNQVTERRSGLFNPSS